MTNDKIIELAQRATSAHIADYFNMNVAELCKFAELVASEERKSAAIEMERLRTLAATAEKWRGIASATHGDGRTVQEIQREAAEIEREACAEIAEAETARYRLVKSLIDGAPQPIPCSIAMAIRARATAPKGGE